MPCAPMPIAKPLCHQAFIPKVLSTKGAKIAPKIPVATAKIAVKVGETLIRSAMPIAIGAVTDLGYIAPAISDPAPSNLAMPTPLIIETRPPVTKEARSGKDLPFKL